MKKQLFFIVFIIFQFRIQAQILTQNQLSADSLFELGEYAESMKMYAVEADLHKDIEPVAYYLYCETQRAECAIRLSDLDEAQAIVQAALKQCPAALVNSKALLQNAQAKIYYQKGLLDQAHAEIMSAIELLKGGTSFYWRSPLSECYNTEGLIDWLRGNDEKSLEYLNQALEIRKELFGEHTAQVAAVYNNMGLVYSGIDSDEAVFYYENALEIYQSIYPENHPALAVAYSNLAQIYRKQEAYNTALTQYEKALEIWEQRYPGMHPNKAFVYSGMAQVYEDKGAYDQALTQAKKALEIYKQEYGRHPNTAACFTLIGSIFTGQREYTKAIHAFQLALMYNTASFTETGSNPDVKEYFDGQLLLSTLTHKAIALSGRSSEKTLRLQDLTQALSCYQSCDTLLDQLRQTRTSKNDKVALGAYSYDIYDKAVELSLFLSQNTFKKKYYQQLAFYFVERSKASVLQESISEAKAKSFAGIPDSKIEEEDTYKTTITYLEQKLAKGISDKDQFKTVSAQLFETKRKYEAFITSLEKNYPAYYNLKYNVQPVIMEAIQAKLSEGDCVLEYFVSEKSKTVTTFVLTNKAVRVYMVPLKDTYSKYISGMRNAIKFDSKATFIKTSTALHKQLIPSLPKHCSHLIIIPDGKMAAIPFEALIEKRPKHDTSSYAQMGFMIKKYATSYTYTASLYENTHEAAKVKKVLLFAPVDFSASSDLNALPGTLAEVDTLTSLCTNTAQADVYTYTAASKAVLVSDSLSGYSIIHLATHGLVDEEQPELSCIYTSGTSEENDRIYAGDMYNMHLNAALVSLSACQTGLGKIEKGEGMIGLSRALFYAGADNIMVSLWKVSDLSTQVYMQYFYSIYLSENFTTFAEAARISKIKLLNSETFNSPYYWAAFILIGK
ncbi:CHAT domain-containing protein [Cytophaga hutchinsonii]|nr:CHAT domain-containing protein [Cytophaga hutchinsonii]SFX00252.1 CHAT domain-containing protein [Cytophaga hutchinsonii ATCC 33406]